MSKKKPDVNSNNLIIAKVAEQLSGRCVLETMDFQGEDGDRTSLWGLQGGHTMVVRRKKRKFLSFEERTSPIGAVAAEFRQH